MILEAAVIVIKAGAREPFEAAYAQASHVIAAAQGYVSHELQRSVDRPGRYLLLVQWRTRDDHMIGFRESPLFTQWRALLGPYFEAAPDVDHLERVPGGAGLNPANVRG